MADVYDKESLLRQRKFQLCRNVAVWKKWSSTSHDPMLGKFVVATATAKYCLLRVATIYYLHTIYNVSGVAFIWIAGIRANHNGLTEITFVFVLCSLSSDRVYFGFSRTFVRTGIYSIARKLYNRQYLCTCKQSYISETWVSPLKIVQRSSIIGNNRAAFRFCFFVNYSDVLKQQKNFPV